MIESLKDLKEFLTICREQTVTEITFSGCHVKFGPVPVIEPVAAPETKSEIDKFIDGQISQEELIFYSAGGPEQQGEA